MKDQNSFQLLSRWRKGDDQAAAEIYDRFVHRLVGLARSRLSNRIQRRVGPEDVVQSAFRSFFHRAGQDEYELRRSGDLWRLLAAITLNKTLRAVEFHTAQKRTVNDEGSISVSRQALDSLSREPTVDEALDLTEVLQKFMEILSPQDRTILELRLSETPTEEIASTINRSTRTIRRRLEFMESALREQLNEA